MRLTNDYVLTNKSVGISISEISEDELENLGQNANHLKQLSQTVAKYVMGCRATLVFGGDLRPKNSFTDYLLEESRILKERLRLNGKFLKNYFAWPIYNANRKELVDWKVKNKEFVEIVEVSGAQISDEEQSQFVKPDSPEHLYKWAKSLTKMRDEMIEHCDARIVAGGKLCGYKGRMPGVLEELIIACKKKKPVYLIGGFGGVAKAVGDFIFADKKDERLSLDWQKQSNAQLSGLLELYEKYDKEDLGYDTVFDVLSSLKINDFNHNGLSKKENERLYESTNPDEICDLILKGLDNTFNK